MKNGWHTKKLAEVCDVDKSQGIHSNLPYVGLEHIESHTGRFIGSTEPFGVRSSTFKFSAEHVLYGRLRPYLNKVMLPDFSGHCSTEIFPLRPRPGLSREFLQYWFLRDATMEQIDATSTGARMPRANMNAVLEFEFPLPPLPEQQRIVGILDEAFEGIATAKANAEKNLQNARALFESHLNSVFTQRGEGWVEKRLEDVVESTCSLSYGIVQPGDEHPNGLPVVRPTDLTAKMIRLDGLKRIDPKFGESYRRTELYGGEILLCVRGTTGAVSVASAELVGANVTRGIVPIRFNRVFVARDFGFYLVNSSEVQRQIREKTYGAALMQINIRDLRNITLLIPPLKEQKAIAAKLDALCAGTQRLESIYRQKLVALEELKKSLLHRAFAGEL